MSRRGYPVVTLRLKIVGISECSCASHSRYRRQQCPWDLVQVRLGLNRVRQSSDRVPRESHVRRINGYRHENHIAAGVVEMCLVTIEGISEVSIRQRDGAVLADHFEDVVR